MVLFQGPSEGLFKYGESSWEVRGMDGGKWFVFSNFSSSTFLRLEALQRYRYEKSLLEKMIGQSISDISKIKKKVTIAAKKTLSIIKPLTATNGYTEGSSTLPNLKGGCPILVKGTNPKIRDVRICRLTLRCALALSFDLLRGKILAVSVMN